MTPEQGQGGDVLRAALRSSPLLFLAMTFTLPSQRATPNQPECAGAPVTENHSLGSPHSPAVLSDSYGHYRSEQQLWAGPAHSE